MSRMSEIHCNTIGDRLDAAELRAAELQSTIDRLAAALGTFPTADLRPTTPALAEAVRAVERARAVLSETGDYLGDYDH